MRYASDTTVYLQKINTSAFIRFVEDFLLRLIAQLVPINLNAKLISLVKIYYMINL